MATTEPESRAKKRKAWKWGLHAEFVCRLRLRLMLWTILDANWRSPVGEIDIIARRGRKLAFVEVKARPRGNLDGPTAQQRRRITRAAQLYIAQHPELTPCFGRFDVMVVWPWPSLRRWWPLHMRDAWREKV